MIQSLTYYAVVLLIVLLLAIVLYTLFKGRGKQNNMSERKVRAPLYEPVAGKVLLFMGQDLEAVGGQLDFNDGYMDYTLPLPSGFTSYTNLNLHGLDEVVDWGAGKTSAKLLVEHPKQPRSMLALGLSLDGKTDHSIKIEKHEGLGYKNDSLSAVNAGLFDKNIKKLARWVRKQNIPVFLRIGFEFNADWTNYSPEEYKPAFQRIVNIFAQNQVENCTYVWQADSIAADQAVEHLMQWYPGDAYVDWIASSYFHAAETEDTLVKIARAQNKPMMLAEVSPSKFDLLESDGKDAWHIFFEPLFEHVRQNADVIKAIAYINVDWPSQIMWQTDDYWNTTDARIQKSPYVTQRWIETLTQDSRWLLGEQAKQYFE